MNDPHLRDPLKGLMTPLKRTEFGGRLILVIHRASGGPHHFSALIRPVSKKGKLLKPRKAPKAVSTLERKFGRLGEHDFRIVRTLEQLALTRDQTARGFAHSNQLKTEIRRLESELIVLAMGLSEVRLGRSVLLRQTAPWRPVLMSQPDGDGTHVLCWVNPPHMKFPGRKAHVIDGDGVLRPVHPGLPHDLFERLDEGFECLHETELAVALVNLADAEHMVLRPNPSVANSPLGQPKPVLLVRHKRKRCSVGFAFEYDQRLVPHDSGGDAFVLLGEGAERGILRRNREREADYGNRFATWEERFNEKGVSLEELWARFFALGAELQGWSVRLNDGPVKPLEIPELTPQVMADEASKSNRDPALSFGAGAYSVSAAKVLKGWRQGRRFMVLPDEAMARLPMEWLGSHGPLAEAIEFLEQGPRGRSGGGREALLAKLRAAVDDEAHREGWLHGYAADLERGRQLAESVVSAALRDYQVEGFAWLYAQYQHGLGCVLADDMGLGKTVQCLGLLNWLHRESPGASLVVAPASVVENWLAEARRFVPGLRCQPYMGPGRTFAADDSVDVYVTTYGILRRDARKLSHRTWRLCVLDEAQNIKTARSATAKVALTLQAEHRIAMTGTPFENHLGELWSVLSFAMPHYLGSRRAFQAQFVRPIAKGNPDEAGPAIERLRVLLKPVVLRRLKSEVLTALPPRQQTTVLCGLSAEEAAVYEDIRARGAETVSQSIREVGFSRSSFTVLQTLTQLRRASCDLRLLREPEADPSFVGTKRRRLLAMLDTLIPQGHRALIFSQWPSFLQLIAEDLRAKDLAFLYLDGGTRERHALQATWNADHGPPVFLISLKAGGTGMNLTGADHVLIMEPWWNPAAEEQALDRAYRIGQSRPVMVYRLITEGTAEERIVALQSRKRATFEATLDQGDLTSAELSLEDVEALFGVNLKVEERLAPLAPLPSGLEGLPVEVAARMVLDGQLTSRSVSEVLGCSLGIARGRLKAWRKAGILKRRGRRQNTRYLPLEE